MRRTKYQKTGQILYRVLTADALMDAQKIVIDAKVKDLKTGEDAEKLAGTGALKHDENNPRTHQAAGWGYRKIIHVDRGFREIPLIVPGSLGILTFNGTEVALFYKRKTVSIQSDECDPIPPYAIKDPNEAWVRVEFLHSKSSVARTSWYTEAEAAYNNRIKELLGLTGSLTVENEMLNSRVLELQKKEEEQTALLSRYKDRYKRSTSKVSTLEGDLDQAYRQISVLKLKLARVQKPRKAAKKTR